MESEDGEAEARAGWNAKTLVKRGTGFAPAK
jgi:hypothetical protein